MALRSREDIERELTDSVRKVKAVTEANAAVRSAAQQPEPEVTSRPVTVQPGTATGPKTSR